MGRVRGDRVGRRDKTDGEEKRGRGGEPLGEGGGVRGKSEGGE